MNRLFYSIRYGGALYFGLILAAIGAGIYGYSLLLRWSWIAAGILSGVWIAASFAVGRRIWPSLWSVLMNSVAALAYTWVFFVSGHGWWMSCLWMILFLPVFILANKSLDFDARRGMRRRSRRGEEIMGQVLAKTGNPIPLFGLFLRPFDSTERLPAQVLRSPTDMSSMSQWSDHLDFETIFSRALQQSMEIVALGSPEDIQDGIARLQVEEMDWQRVVKKMAKKASLIIALPLYREGTMWELRLLKEKNYFGKTIFLMPEMQRPQPSGVVVATTSDRAWDAGFVFHDSAAHAFDFPTEWRLARDKLKDDGIFLPPYMEDGAFFTLDSDSGKLNRIAPLPLSVLSNRQKYIQTVLELFDLLERESDGPHVILTALEEATFPNIRNREYVLTLAFKTYLAVADADTAQAVLDRIKQIVGDRQLMVDEMIAALPGLLGDVNHRSDVLAMYEPLSVWLKTLNKVDGVDASQVKKARQQLKKVYADAQSG